MGIWALVVQPQKSYLLHWIRQPFRKKLLNAVLYPKSLFQWIDSAIPYPQIQVFCPYLVPPLVVPEGRGGEGGAVWQKVMGLSKFCHSFQKQKFLASRFCESASLATSLPLNKIASRLLMSHRCFGYRSFSILLTAEFSLGTPANP